MSFIIMLVTAMISPPPVVVTAKMTIIFTRKLPIAPIEMPATVGATRPEPIWSAVKMVVFV